MNSTKLGNDRILMEGRTTIAQGLLAITVFALACGSGEGSGYQEDGQPIVNGADAAQNAQSMYPAVVALIPIPRENPNDAIDWTRVQVAAVAHLCSATLVAPNVVLTTAHCAHSGQVREELVKKGVCNGLEGQSDNCKSIELAAFLGPDVSNASDRNPLKAGRMIFAAESNVHPSYNPGAPLGGYDLALVRLREDVREVEPIKIDLSKLGLSDGGKSVRFVGYGYSQEHLEWTSLVPTRIQENLGIRRVAEAKLKILWWNWRCIYTSEKEDGVYTTSGDSGGPVITDWTGVQKLIGVHSWGSWSLKVGMYGTSERVDLHASWLRSALRAWGIDP